MARFRVSPLAEGDLASILSTSVERWGTGGYERYASLLVSAIRSVAGEPEGATTRDRSELAPGLRSFHLRQIGEDHGVAAPVHVLYYRAVRPGLIEIVRVLHECMEPSAHLDAPRGRKRRRRP